jgi:hypothetical protein
MAEELFISFDEFASNLYNDIRFLYDEILSKEEIIKFLNERKEEILTYASTDTHVVLALFVYFLIMTKSDIFLSFIFASILLILAINLGKCYGMLFNEEHYQVYFEKGTSFFIIVFLMFISNNNSIQSWFKEK